MLQTKYNRARYYDPMAGRFISVDPILHPVNGPPKVSSCSGSISYPAFDSIKKNPQALNPYVYVNNPINYTDPSGLSASVNNNSGWNGNYWLGFSPQDNVCSSPAGIFNSNICTKKCCENHDLCYEQYGCNASSWFGNFMGNPGACQSCNAKAASCIANNVGKKECECQQ